MVCELCGRHWSSQLLASGAQCVFKNWTHLSQAGPSPFTFSQLLLCLDNGYEMNECNVFYSISSYEFSFPKTNSSIIISVTTCNHLEQLTEDSFKLFQKTLIFLLNFQNKYQSICTIDITLLTNISMISHIFWMCISPLSCLFSPVL